MKPLHILLFTLTATFLFSCDKNNEIQDKLASDEGKIWYRFTEAEGDSLNQPAKDMETWTFYSDGNMTMNLSEGAMPGTWEYDPAEKILLLDVNANTIGFTVNHIKKKLLVLEASDGGIVELKAENPRSK